MEIKVVEGPKGEIFGLMRSDAGGVYVGRAHLTALTRKHLGFRTTIELTEFIEANTVGKALIQLLRKCEEYQGGYENVPYETYSASLYLPTSPNGDPLVTWLSRRAAKHRIIFSSNKGFRLEDGKTFDLETGLEVSFPSEPITVINPAIK
jgi:hypothetical protein